MLTAFKKSQWGSGQAIASVRTSLCNSNMSGAINCDARWYQQA